MRRVSGGGAVREAVLAGFVLFAAILLVAGPAHAGTVINERPFLFSFNGADAAAGPFTEPSSIAVDDGTEAVYVTNDRFPEGGSLSKFSANGTASSFGSTGSSSLFGFSNLLGVAVDNSSGPNQGHIYVSQFANTRARAFDASGNLLWTLFPGTGQLRDIAVDASGHPWITGSTEPPPTEYEAAGSPPFPNGCSIAAAGEAEAIDLDVAGNLYAARLGGIRKYTKTGTCAYTESTLDPSAESVYVDQSSPSGHVFTVQTGIFEEYESSGSLLGTYGESYLSQGGGRIAYNPMKNWVYVIQRLEPHPVVAVFGPPASGSVPDVTEVAAPVSVGVSSAHFSGKVNPKSISASAHFEWKRPNESWAAAASSPPQALPVDEAEHTVEFDTDELRGDTAYEVRLVTTNDTDKLHAFSAEVKNFTTEKAVEAPAVTIFPITVFGATTATVEGTVNPKGDTADWRVEVQVACAGPFSPQRPQTIAHEASSAVPVEYQLEGLLPSERYCVQIVATNSFDATTSETKEFETQATIPDEVETLAVAPRLDTSARLNARVNPEGAPLTYRFEYSEDGGTTWIPLENREDMSKARESIVVGEELQGLAPNATYRYRFMAENATGEASPQGGERSFTTRTVAEVASPGRGVELVNNPDKGNQNVHAEVQQGTPPMTADGEKVLWNVLAGAPGGNSGTGATFLAERTPSGWRSRGLTPPGEEQIGKAEEGGYNLDAATPSFSAFVFTAGAALEHVQGGRTLVRVDANQNQTLLGEYEREVSGERVDITDDGAHVLFVSVEEPGQLEDIGSGARELVSVMPDGLPNECGLVSADENNSFVGGGNAPRGAAKQWRPGYHMIATTDASQVYFQAKPNGSSSCESALYALYERNRDTGETTLLDPGTSGHSPQFVRATPNGRSGYFVTYGNCRRYTQGGSPTCESVETADANSAPDVYRWDEETGESSCLTCVVPDANVSFKEGGEGSGGRVLISDDFSHVYFESTDQLVPGQGKAGDLNVYSLSDGNINFVADVNAEVTLGDAVQLSSDGNVLLFTTSRESSSHQKLTADELASECASPGEKTAALPCEELFRYDDSDGSLECLSCRRGGVTTNDLGSPEATNREEFQMSSDGDTAAFVTQEALVPLDVNGSVDIYEWRNGVVRLITNGVSSFPTGLLTSPGVHAVNANGGDILFSLVAPGLTGFEQDGFANLYDARIGGGFEPPIPPAHCAEESCQGPLQAPPASDRPASSGFSGAGNQKSGSKRGRRVCSKKHGKARRRCVKRHSNSHKGRQAR